MLPILAQAVPTSDLIEAWSQLSIGLALCLVLLFLVISGGFVLVRQQGTIRTIADSAKKTADTLEMTITTQGSMSTQMMASDRDLQQTMVAIRDAVRQQVDVTKDLRLALVGMVNDHLIPIKRAVDDDLAVSKKLETSMEAMRTSLAEAQKSLDTVGVKLDDIRLAVTPGVLVHSPNGSILSWNPAGLKVMQRLEPAGVGPVADVLGADGARILKTEDWPVMRAITTGENVSGVIMGLLGDAGQRIWVDASAQVVRDQAGAILYVVARFTDLGVMQRRGAA